MDIEMLFIIASLIFGVTVIVAANVWAVAGPPQTELQQSLSQAIEDILAAEDATRKCPPNAMPPSMRET